jgi:hypothetical protein
MSVMCFFVTAYTTYVFLDHFPANQGERVLAALCFASNVWLWVLEIKDRLR